MITNASKPSHATGTWMYSRRCASPIVESAGATNAIAKTAISTKTATVRQEAIQGQLGHEKAQAVSDQDLDDTAHAAKLCELTAEGIWK